MAGCHGIHGEGAELEHPIRNLFLARRQSRAAQISVLLLKVQLVIIAFEHCCRL